MKKVVFNIILVCFLGTGIVSALPAPVLKVSTKYVNSGNQVELWWKPVPEAIRYEVKKGSDLSFEHAQIKTLQGTRTSFQLYGIPEAEITFYFYVEVVRRGEMRARSNVVTVHVRRGESHKLGAPDGVPILWTISRPHRESTGAFPGSRRRVVSNQAFELGWTTPPRTSGFYLVASKNRAFPCNNIVAVNTDKPFSYQKQRIRNATTYYYRVRATNSYGHTAWSNVATVEVQSTKFDLPPPIAPFLSVDRSTVLPHERYTLNWTSVPEVSGYPYFGYYLYGSESPFFPPRDSTQVFVQDTHRNFTSHSPYGREVNESRTLYYQVRAYTFYSGNEEMNFSDWSNVVQVTFQPKSTSSP